MKTRERERDWEKKWGCIILLNQNPYWNAFDIFLINLLSFFKMLILQLLKRRSKFIYILSTKRNAMFLFAIFGVKNY